MNAIENLPSRIDFGAGCVARVGERAAELGESAFVVTDRGVLDAGLCERAFESLRAAGVAFDVFADARPNPRDEDLAAAADAFRASGRRVLVAIGGGSVMDAAKGAALLAQHEGAASDYRADRKGFERIRGDLPPVLAVPTTAGSGSEMTGAVVVSDEAARSKVVVLSPRLKPAAIVLDPELTRTLPPRLTAIAGLDALAHAVEAFCVDAFHPFADAWAKEAVELIAGSLCAAVADGDDLAARADLLLAAALAGGAMAMKGLGLCHALAHQIDSAPHGLVNAVLLPHVMRFNAEPAGDKLRRVAELLGADVSGLDDDKAAAAAADAAAAIRSAVELERSLAEIGCAEEDIDRIVRRAPRDPCFRTNPRRGRLDELRALLHAALVEEGT